MIPRIMHRIWLGANSGDPIPAEFEDYWQRLKALHPGWQFQTWSGVPLNLWNREAFYAATTHAGRSDVLRYEVLARRGGIYLDTDVEPLRSFEPLLNDDRPFAAWEDKHMICPTVMGSPAEHPATAALVAALGPWAKAHKGQPPNRQTGPYFLTAQWKDRTDVRLLEPEAFYPIHWSDKASLGGPYPKESYAVHHWAAGWLPNGPPQRPRAGAR